MDLLFWRNYDPLLSLFYPFLPKYLEFIITPYLLFILFNHFYVRQSIFIRDSFFSYLVSFYCSLPPPTLPPRIFISVIPIPSIITNSSLIHLLQDFLYSLTSGEECFLFSLNLVLVLVPFQGLPSMGLFMFFVTLSATSISSSSFPLVPSPTPVCVPLTLRITHVSLKYPSKYSSPVVTGSIRNRPKGIDETI